MSVNNGIVVSRPSAEWTRQEPGPWRGRCTPLPSFCPGRSVFLASKKLTAKKRNVLFDQITATAEAYSIAFVTAEEIDSLDILNARMLAMNRAIEGLSIRPDLCLIDGNRDHGSSVSITAPHMCLVGGDGKSASIAAASILAKVSRDRYVTGVLDREYPQYQFAKHKGYGTKLHYEMLDRYGPCPAHRRTFLKKWEARRT